MKWRCGSGEKRDSLVRVENRGVGTAKKCVFAIVGLTYVSTVRTAQKSFVKFATGQLNPTDAIIKNNGNIPRQINAKYLEHIFVSYFSLLAIIKSVCKHRVNPRFPKPCPRAVQRAWRPLISYALFNQSPEGL